MSGVVEVAQGHHPLVAAHGMALAHLLACLDRAVDLLDESGCDVDARVVEAHRAQLARGAEWPGDPVRPWHGPDELGPRPVGDGSAQ